MRLFLFIIAIMGGPAMASSTRTLDADLLQSSDHTKTFTPPSSSQTLVGRTSADTITNKTIVGGLNTLSQLPVQSQIASDNFYGSGSTTAFTLSNSIIATSGVQVLLNGVQQYLTTDYSISGTTLTFVTAPSAGQKITVVYSIY